MATTTSHDFLSALDLDDEADQRDIRRAYARKLKQLDLEADPAAFQALRTTYETALAWAQDDLAAPTEATDAQEADETQPNGALSEEQLAITVYERFQAALVQLRQAGRLWDPEAWRQQLLLRLEDEELQNIGARTRFEAVLVHVLAQGWQPGTENLFVTAADAFAWESNRRRLALFGEAGALLNRALDERALFDSQDQGTRAVQEAIAMRLRQPLPPSESEILHKITEIQAMAERFPVLMHVIVGSDNIARWRRAFERSPSVQKSEAMPATMWHASTIFSLVVALLLLLSLLRHAFLLPVHRASTTPSQAQAVSVEEPPVPAKAP